MRRTRKLKAQRSKPACSGSFDEEVYRARRVVGDAPEQAAGIVPQAEQAATHIIERAGQEPVKLFHKPVGPHHEAAEAQSCNRTVALQLRFDLGLQGPRPS